MENQLSQESFGTLTRMRESLSSLLRSPLLRVGVILLILAVIPLTVFISQKQQEIRQRASGEQTSLYFTNVGYDIPLTTVSLLSNEQKTIRLYLDTKGNAISGFDVTITFPNSQNTIRLGQLTEGADAQQRFNSPVFNNVDPGTNTIRFAKVATDANTVINGVLYLADIALTPTASGSGNFSITNGTITSPTTDTPLTVSQPTVSYLIGQGTAVSPTPTPTPTVAQVTGPTGPCYQKSAGTCTFDSREIFTAGSGKQVESVTAYGKFYNWTLEGNGRDNPWPSNGQDLTTVPRYAEGPCRASSVATIHETSNQTRTLAPGTCKFDSRVVNQQMESLTAYGKGWNWNISSDGRTFTPWRENPIELTSVTRYAQGPCAGKAAGTCTFDTRAIANVAGKQVESVTAYGKFYNWVIDNNTYNPLPDFGADLTSVARYAQGPCQRKQVGTCQFDSYVMVMLGNTLVESVSAYGKGWNWNISSDGRTFTPWRENPIELTSVTRYVYPASATISPTPTGALSPTPTGVLTPTPTSTPTTGTLFDLTLNLTGVGERGNQNPRTLQKQLQIEVLNNSGSVTFTGPGSISFDPPSNSFKGTVRAGSLLVPGNYMLKIKTPRYLKKLVPGIQTVTENRVGPYVIPPITLIAGDANDDNKLDIEDYNILLSCFGDKANTSSCVDKNGNNIKDSVDFDDNNIIDGVDYNLFIRSLSVKEGD